MKWWLNLGIKYLAHRAEEVGCADADVDDDDTDDEFCDNDKDDKDNDDNYKDNDEKDNDMKKTGGGEQVAPQGLWGSRWWMGLLPGLFLLV